LFAKIRLAKASEMICSRLQRKKLKSQASTLYLSRQNPPTREPLSFYRNKGFVEQEQVLEKLKGTEVNLTVLKLNLRKT